MFKGRPVLTARNKGVILFLDLVIFIFIVCFVYFFRMDALNLRILLAPGLWFICLSVLSSLYIFGAYDLEDNKPYFQIVVRQIMSILLSLCVVVLVNYFFSKDRTGIFGRGILISSLLLFLIISGVYRYFLWTAFTRARLAQEWLFVLSKKSEGVLQKEFQKFQFLRKSSVLVDAPMDQIQKALEKPWSAVVIGIENEKMVAIGSELMKSRLKGQYILDLGEYYELIWKKVPVEYLSPQWFIFEKGFYLLHNPLVLRAKRLGDVGVSLLLFCLTWPLMLLTAILIKLESRGPVIYQQNRTGKDGRVFNIFKFRSMAFDAEKHGVQWAKQNDARVTIVGKWIRKTRIDELPQLWNVLKGEMSFIGPRPERPEFNVNLESEIPYYSLRHLVRPGISGWAQILYPYGASVEDSREKLQYDLYYIKNQSLWLDFQIILKTIKVVLFGLGR